MHYPAPHMFSLNLSGSLHTNPICLQALPPLPIGICYLLKIGTEAPSKTRIMTYALIMQHINSFSLSRTENKNRALCMLIKQGVIMKLCCYFFLFYFVFLFKQSNLPWLSRNLPPLSCSWDTQQHTFSSRSKILSGAIALFRACSPSSNLFME